MTARSSRRARRLADWPALGRRARRPRLCASTGAVLDARTSARSLVDLYDDDARFRSTIDMARHRFGEGQYRYFARPLPERRRPSCGPRSGRTCCRSPGTGRSGWAARRRGPTTSTTGSTHCHAAGQARPTPLLLRYGPGDWNALHRDLYGDLVFPLQVVIGLDRAGRSTTPAASSSSSSSGRGPSRGPRRRRSRRARRWCSRRSDRPVRSSTRAGRRPRCATASAPCAPGRRRTLGLVFHDAR